MELANGPNLTVKFGEVVITVLDYANLGDVPPSCLIEMNIKEIATYNYSQL